MNLGLMSLAHAQDTLTQRHLDFLANKLTEKFSAARILENENIQITHIYNYTDEQKLDFQKAITIFAESSHLKLAKKSKHQLIFALKGSNSHRLFASSICKRLDIQSTDSYP